MAVRPEMEIRAGAVDVRAGTGRTLHGIAAPYGSSARIGGSFTETIAPGAFSTSLAGGNDVLALADHDPARLLGRTRSGTLSLRDQPDGLMFSLELPRTTLGDDMLELARRGDLGGVSIGFTVPVGGDEWSGDQRTLRGIDLAEISIIAAHPAYSATTIAVRCRGVADADAYARRERELELTRWAF